MDLTSLIGLVVGVGSIFLALVLEEGELSSIVNVPGAVIVFGGTLGATVLSSSLSTLVSLPRLIALVFKPDPPRADGLVEFFAGTANKARREGLLSLENQLEEIDQPFLRRGLMMVVDGIDPAMVREILQTEIEHTAERHREGYTMLELMGGYAPTMGILGAVMGLISVLSSLSSPENIGHSIAVAFVATLYGVGTANLMWLPLGAKLKKKSELELFARRLMLEGVLSVQAGHNPHIVREHLTSFIAPRERAAAQAGTAGATRPGERAARAA